MKVENMVSQAGNPVPNQFIIRDDKGNRIFQSYNVIVAKVDKEGQIHLDSRYWDYSRTTTRYLNIFLRAKPGELKRAVREGKIVPEDLNK